MAIEADKQRKLNNDLERALIKRVAEKDRDSLSQLYLMYHGRIFKFVFRLTGSYTVADELVNDVMLLVWQKAATFRGESKVSTWIFGITYRLTMRRITKKTLAICGHSDVNELAADAEQPLETEDWIRRGIDALPAAQQVTVILVFYLGLSYEEVAEVIKCPVNTVKTRMFHARRKLKSLLTEHATPGSFQGEVTHE